LNKILVIFARYLLNFSHNLGMKCFEFDFYLSDYLYEKEAKIEAKEAGMSVEEYRESVRKRFANAAKSDIEKYHKVKE
jgi:hypothetical protein